MQNMSSVLTGERLLTIEEFADLPPASSPRELVRGRILFTNPPFPWHGYVCGRATLIFGNFIDQNALGRFFCNDTGVITSRDPDSLRGADFLFYSYNRVPR